MLLVNICIPTYLFIRLFYFSYLYLLINGFIIVRIWYKILKHVIILQVASSNLYSLYSPVYLNHPRYLKTSVCFVFRGTFIYQFCNVSLKKLTWDYIINMQSNVTSCNLEKKLLVFQFVKTEVSPSPKGSDN